MATFYDRNNKTTRLTDGTSLNPLTFTRDSGKWIYCNYPENLHTDSLGDRNLGNHYLNHVQVNGPAQVFASHTNNTGYEIYFAIQLYNAGSRSVTVTRENNCFRYSLKSEDTWAITAGEVWKSFFNNPDGTQFTVAPGKAAWIFTSGKIPKDSFFNAVVRFRTTGTLHCFPYVYCDRNAVDGTASCYDWKSGTRMYRGEGDSYFIRTSLNLKVSQMPYKYLTCDCASGNTNEMISIYDPCAKQSRTCSSGDNLGNWGVQYLFNVAVLNDTSTAKTIKAYIGPGGNSQLVIPVINFNGTVKWSDPRHDNINNQWWNWLEDSIPANTSRTYQYQFIHAANGSSPVLHGWRLA